MSARPQLIDQLVCCISSFQTHELAVTQQPLSTRALQKIFVVRSGSVGKRYDDGIAIEKLKHCRNAWTIEVADYRDDLTSANGVQLRFRLVCCGCDFLKRESVRRRDQEGRVISFVPRRKLVENSHSRTADVYRLSADHRAFGREQQ